MQLQAPRKPHGRSVGDFDPLTPAEALLVKHCYLGTAAVIASSRPVKASPKNSVRAEFLRFLLLGGDELTPVHERGVQLQGAFIRGDFNLEATTVSLPMTISRCVFSESIEFNDTKFENSIVLDESSLRGFQGQRMIVGGQFSMNGIVSNGQICIEGAEINGCIYMEGSQLNANGEVSLAADGVKVNGDVFFVRGFLSQGRVNFPDAHIHGQFCCDSASFEVSSGRALSLEGAVIYGDVLLQGGFNCKGMTSLIGATIMGILVCDGGEFDGLGAESLFATSAQIKGDVYLRTGFVAKGDVDFSGAEIGGEMDLAGSEISVLTMEHTKIGGTFRIRKLRTPLTFISVEGASVSMLDDDNESWGKRVFLNGFIYKIFDIYSPVAGVKRIAWLDCQPMKSSDPTSSFQPQPWKQLIKVLEEMGHAEDARQVGIAYEERLRKYGIIGQMPNHWAPWRRKLFSRLVSGLHYGYGKLTGFGYRPHLLLGWFFCVWMGCSAIYWTAAAHGVFAPSNPLVFQNDEYVTCRPDRASVWQLKNPDVSPKNIPIEFKGKGNWYLCTELREEFTGFSPIAFSLDLLLPLVDLHQENDWAPLIETPKANVFCEFFSFFFNGKRLVRFVMWMEILSGWLFSLLFVAVVSGLTRRKD